MVVDSNDPTLVKADGMPMRSSAVSLTMEGINVTLNRANAKGKLKLKVLTDVVSTEAFHCRSNSLISSHLG